MAVFKPLKFLMTKNHILQFFKQLPTKYWLILVLSFAIGVLWTVQNLFSVDKKTAPSALPSSLPSSQPHFLLPSVSPIPSVKEKSEKGDPTYWQEINRQLENNFPLITQLPYETSQFVINYRGPLELEIKLKTASESAKTEALKWIESQGVATQSHEIIFK